MKTFFFSLVILLAALLIACQESSITDPLTGSSSEKDMAYYNNLNKHNIRLDASLLDPRPNSPNHFDLTGSVQYGLSFVNTGTSQDPAFNTIVKLKINARLQCSNITIDNTSKPCLTVNNESLEYLKINLTSAREQILVKSYCINGCNNQLRLICTYAVTTNKVSVKSLRLCCGQQSVNLVAE
jgi:hypothetical protein